MLTANRNQVLFVSPILLVSTNEHRSLYIFAKGNTCCAINNRKYNIVDFKV